MPPSTVDPLAAALEGARAGDDHAFAVLWRDLQPRLLRYLGVRGEYSPEDVAAETWLHVVRGLPDFVGDVADFRAWLFTLARRRAIDAGRARAARPAVPMADPDPGGVTPSAEAGAMERIGTEAALRLVAMLPPAQAEMVMLRVVAGLDVSAVAAILGKEPGTVRVGVHRALAALAKQMEAGS